MNTSLYSPTQLKQMAMCDEYAKGNRTLNDCCKAVGITSAQHYYWLRNDTWYQKGWQVATEMYQAYMTQLLDDRIRNGAVDVKTTYTIITDPNTGEQVKIPVEEVHHKRYSDTLLMRYLAAIKPEEFGKAKKQEVNSDLAERIIAGRKRVSAAASENNNEPTD